MKKRLSKLFLAGILSLLPLNQALAQETVPAIDEVPALELVPTEGRLCAQESSLTHEVSKPRILEFEAPWCKHCKDVKPSMLRLAKKYKGKIEVIDIDVTDPANRELMQVYGVTMLPTLVFQRTSSEYYMIFGSSSEEEIDRDAKAILKCSK